MARGKNAVEYPNCVRRKVLSTCGIAIRVYVLLCHNLANVRDEQMVRVGIGGSRRGRAPPALTIEPFDGDPISLKHILTSELALAGSAVVRRVGPVTGPA